MSDLIEQLRAAQIAARKSGEKDRTLVLGTVLAALKNREIDSPGGLSDSDGIEVIRKQVKQREDSREQYLKADRPELAEKEAWEITVLREFLPAELDPEVIRTAARELFAGGATAMGPLMGALMARFKGQADGKVINAIVREVLQQG